MRKPARCKLAGFQFVWAGKPARRLNTCIVALSAFQFKAESIMDYYECFFGGPLDGTKRRTQERGGYHPTCIAEQNLAAGPAVMAIYQHAETKVTNEEIQRVYRYHRSMPHAEAHEFVQASRREPD